MPKVKKVDIKSRDHNQKENISSTLKSKSRMLAYNKNKINRWISLLNSGENINISFLKIFSEIEENIMNRIELIQSKVQDLINDSDISDKFCNRKILKDLKESGIELPIENLSTFIKFDEELETDPKKETVLKRYIASLIDIGENLNKDITQIMKNIMTTNVQKHYSGNGRSYKGRRKLCYSQTNAYLCMQDVLTNKYKKPSDELKILPAVSRWLTQYRDRLPGSYHRRKHYNHSESEESSASYSE